MDTRATTYLPHSLSRRRGRAVNGSAGDADELGRDVFAEAAGLGDFGEAGGDGQIVTVPQFVTVSPGRIGWVRTRGLGRFERVVEGAGAPTRSPENPPSELTKRGSGRSPRGGVRAGQRGMRAGGWFARTTDRDRARKPHGDGRGPTPLTGRRGQRPRTGLFAMACASLLNVLSSSATRCARELRTSRRQ